LSIGASGPPFRGREQRRSFRDPAARGDAEDGEEVVARREPVGEEAHRHGGARRRFGEELDRGPGELALVIAEDRLCRTPIANQSNHIVLRRIGARGDAMTTNNSVWDVSRSRDSLLEDVWGWGYGRYVLGLYGCTQVTVRRGVFRWDGWGIGADKPGDPKFTLGVYDTHDSLIEDVLLLDAATTTLGGDKGGLFVPGNANGNTAPYGDSDNNTFQGLIALNNAGHGVGVEGGSGGSNDNNRFLNLVSWGNSGHGVTVAKKATGTVFEHVTVGRNGHGFYFGTAAYDGVSGSQLTNSLVYANAAEGLNGPADARFDNVFGNGTNYSGGAAAGTGSISQDPLLDVILRLEPDSPDKGTAADGGDMGATVLKSSVDGVLTTTDLWPWPYQDRIRADLCESATRGFCGSSWASLTDYVWGQIQPTPPPPPPPSCLTAADPSPRWQNQGFTSQSGRFTAEADVTPSSGGVDAALSLGSGPQTSWDGLAATVLFYTDGRIKAIAGSGYTAGALSYSAGLTYHIRLVVDVPQHLYSAYVTLPGGSEQAIGTDLAFRTGQGSVASLDTWTASADVDSLTACALAVSPPPPPPQGTTAIFQQGLNAYVGVTDTWINFYDPNVNFNSETQLDVLGTEDIKALVRFDLSSIPAGAQVTSATLELYNYALEGAANGGVLSVYPVGRAWVEAEATWNRASAASAWTAPGMQAGTDYRTSPVASITVDTSTGVWRSFDVTAIVQGWLAGTLQNFGFVVRSPDRGVKPLFYSSGFTANPALRPRLTVVY
jgi:disaggregatase-related protein/TGF-beta propeptide